MVWVKSEYAGELAVVATWLTALLPWSVSYLKATPEWADSPFTVINIRFVFFQVHYVFDSPAGQQSLGGLFQPVYEVTSFESLRQVVNVQTWQPDCPPGSDAFDASLHFVPCNQVFEARLWLLAAVGFLLLILFSVVYYAREDLVEQSPVDPVRVFGVAFALFGTVLTVSSVMYFKHQPTAPVGALFMLVFAGMLLRVERT